jgi:hypothetical protein
MWHAGAFRLQAGASGFRYLSQSQAGAESCYSLDDVDDGEGLRTTLDAMQIVGIGWILTLTLALPLKSARALKVCQPPVMGVPAVM